MPNIKYDQTTIRLAIDVGGNEIPLGKVTAGDDGTTFSLDGYFGSLKGSGLFAHSIFSDLEECSHEICNILYMAETSIQTDDNNEIVDMTFNDMYPMGLKIKNDLNKKLGLDNKKGND